MNRNATEARPRHSFQTDDPALEPIAEKVQRSERLSCDDGLALYRSGDILIAQPLVALNLRRNRLQRPIVGLKGVPRPGLDCVAVHGSILPLAHCKQGVRSSMSVHRECVAVVSATDVNGSNGDATIFGSMTMPSYSVAPIR